MLDWLFKPACPCDPAAKAWIEDRLAWLAAEFPDSAFSGRRVVLPTRDFFPNSFGGSEAAIRQLLDRVCDYMDVAPALVEMKITDQRGKVWLVNESGDYLPSGFAGTYSEGEDSFIIKIDIAEMDNLVGMVGTMAHELAHVRLLGESRISNDAFDHELLTDLTTVHFGLGIFLANSPRAWKSKMSTWPNSNLRMPKYMSAPMYAWALAHLALFRGESKPLWARHLETGARANLKQGIKYLLATGDSQYKP